MSKLVLIIGVVLMVASFGILMFIVQGAENPTVANILESMHCTPPEKFVEIRGPYTRDSFDNSYSQSVAFYCEIEPGQRRDVTAPAFFTLAGGFVIPFVLGLLMTIGGITRAARNYTRKMTQQAIQYANIYNQSNPLQSNPIQSSGQDTVIDLRGGGSLDGVDIPPHARQILEGVFGNLSTFMATNNSSNLTERLQQLQEARDKGLITDAEYDQVRQSILDNFDD